MNTRLISPEELEIINKRLAEKYGKLNNSPCFRVSWSDDQFEHRKTEVTREGLRLTNPKVELLPKYWWIKERYILEGLREVPIQDSADNIVGFKISYEIIWTFEDANENALSPKWNAVYLILETLKSNQENAGKVKYKDPNSDPEEALELKKQRILDLEKDLFGDETAVGDALAYKTGVTVGEVAPHNTTQGEVK